MSKYVDLETAKMLQEIGYDGDYGAEYTTDGVPLLGASPMNTEELIPCPEWEDVEKWAYNRWDMRFDLFERNNVWHMEVWDYPRFDILYSDIGEDSDRAFNKGVRFMVEYIKKQQESDNEITGWIARDSDGELWMYEVEPERFGSVWSSFAGFSTMLPAKKFCDLKWEDEPKRVKITIKEE